jgi:single-stranded DNA-binding protein
VTVFSESLAAKLAALRAGAQVAVGGALEQYRWTSKAGEERVGFRLVATELISTRDAKARRERPAGTGDDEPPREAPARAARRGQAPAESQRGSLAEMEDDIPF